MNGKKARLLRKLAQTANVEKHMDKTVYQEIPETARQRQVTDLNGDVLFTYRTVTMRISAGPRFVYKALKKMYKKSQVRDVGVLSNSHNARNALA